MLLFLFLFRPVKAIEIILAKFFTPSSTKTNRRENTFVLNNTVLPESPMNALRDTGLREKNRKYVLYNLKVNASLSLLVVVSWYPMMLLMIFSVN